MNQSSIEETAEPPVDELASDESADNPANWVSHPINIRVSIPLFHRRFYFTIVAGEERRRQERREAEREAHPLVTAGNIFFTLGVATLFTIAAIGILIAQSAIIE